MCGGRPSCVVPALVACLLYSSLSAWAQDRSLAPQPAISTELELLRAEVLDTVSLANPVHFVTPDIVDVVASPDTYRLEAAEPNRLKLVSLKGTRALTIDALVTSHDYNIATPIALYVQDDEKFPHVVLLLPGGKGLEAVGSYEAVRARGLVPTLLTPEQIREAITKKRATPPPAGGTIPEKR